MSVVHPNPQTSYGSNSIQNRVKPGGTLGSNQYYYTTNAKTGEITVNRYAREKVGRGSFRNVETKVGTIPQGGSFVPNPSTSDAEKTFYGSEQQKSKVRQQALQIARREWDGRTQPPPNTAIYGENAINAAYGATNSNGGTENYTTPQNLAGDISDAANIFNSANNKGLSFGEGLGLAADLLGLGGSSGSKPVLVYPTSMRRSGAQAQDYIQIDMLKYAPKKMGATSGNISGFGSRQKNRKTLGTVVLPIPGGISDSNAVTWGGDKMNAAEAAAASVALAGVTENLGAAAGKAGEAFKAGTRGTGGAEVKKALGTAIAGAASGTGASLLTRTTGNIMNPNMELLFKEPSLRPFNFTWKLSPRSKEEAQEIIKIIRFFKKGMAPIKSEANLFLQSPNTWKLSYKHKGQDHKYLNRFKECAINSFTVQYTPDGNYATFEDGVMTSYSITMALQELEPVFSNDYKDAPGIGY
tara:strand:- start:695 stop:2101 length:1407 start_codon:yes stop_codon:yes gene_type:complete